MDVRECKRRGTWSPCTGGQVTQSDGDGYCAAGHGGPRCEVCVNDLYYFRSSDAKCHACQNGARAAAFVGVLLAGLAALSLIAFLLHMQKLPKQGLARKTVKLVKWNAAVVTSAGTRNKLKILLGFYQCIGAVPSNFDLSAPEGLRWMIDWIEVPTLFGIQILLPGECLGDYQRRLLVGATWPFAFILLIVVAFIGWKVSRVAASHGLRSVTEASCIEWQLSIVNGMRQSLPITLVITFILLPPTANRIFRGLICDSFGVADDCSGSDCHVVTVRRYLRDDLAFECDTAEYDVSYRMTLVLIGLWPIGVPTLYALLLYINRISILQNYEMQQLRNQWVRNDATEHSSASQVQGDEGGDGKAIGDARDSSKVGNSELEDHTSGGVASLGLQASTETLASATAFLWEDLQPGYFWWEPMEQLRKLTLTGFVLLVPREAKLGRIIIAQSTSLAFLTLQLICMPYRRAEDNWLMIFVQLTLLVLFQAVAAIVTCELSPENCSAYGFGSTSRGIFLTFGIFSIVMLLIILTLTLGKLWFTGRAPRILRVASMYSLPPTLVLSRYAVRRWDMFRRWFSSAIGFDRPRVSPRDLEAIWEWRARKGRPLIVSAPDEVLTVTTGVLLEMALEGFSPTSTCYVQVDPTSFTLHWTARDYLSLYTITEVSLMGRISQGVVSQAQSATASTMRRSSAKATFGTMGSMQINFWGLEGTLRTLVLTMPPQKALSWQSSLEALRKAAPPAPGSIGHMLWTISCMRTAGEAMPGFVRRSNFRSVLIRANIQPSQQQVEEALQRGLGAPLPLWMRRDGDGFLNVYQIATALAFLSCSQPELTRVFEIYSIGTTMSRSQWLEFVRAEQLEISDGNDSVAVGTSSNESAEIEQLHLAELQFTRTMQSTGGDLSTDEGLELQQFVQQLLSPENDAVAPTVEHDFSAPLSHYWGATSHNSYIVGDQLTGLSSADAYRRQLIQGCRHVEIDCWDGKKAPSVTHGHTLVTIETFAAVAQAIAETAFVTSELPVILSLEMHCSLPQQKQIAELLLHHLGSKVLTYDELCAMKSPTSLSPQDLKRRVLVKGKVADIIDAKDRNSKSQLSLDEGSIAEGSLDEGSIILPIDYRMGVGDTLPLSKKERKQRKTDAMLASVLTLRSVKVRSFRKNEKKWPLPITSIEEDKLLELMGLSAMERSEVEGLVPGAPPASPDNRALAFSRMKRSLTAARLAFDPPAKVVELQQRTMQWLTRPYPLGLRFSGINMDPLPCWLAGTQYVCLNMCQNDLPVQLHHALFNGTGGYVLKPLEMRTGVPWPPPRDALRRVTIEVLSLHNLPKQGERRPRLHGKRSACHKYFGPELSGTSVPPDASEPSTVGLQLSLCSIGGFCALGSTLPLPSENNVTEWSTRATASKNGLNVHFCRKTLHCLAAEPDSTFLRVVALDHGREVAYETAVLGRLRRGYRVFQLRCELGTRIEQCYLLVKISFGSELNRWPTPSHLRQTSLLRASECMELRSRNEAQAYEILELRRENEQLKKMQRKWEEMQREKQHVEQHDDAHVAATSAQDTPAGREAGAPQLEYTPYDIEHSSSELPQPTPAPKDSAMSWLSATMERADTKYDGTLLHL